MSLIYCPECGHEVSQSAVACPNCGRPLKTTPVVERKVVTNVVRRRKDGFPTWGYFVIGTLGILLLFILLVATRNSSDDEANQQIRVNANVGRTAANREVVSSAPSAVTDVPSTGSSSVTLPSDSTSAPVAVPMPSAPGYTTTVPGSQTTVAAPTKGKVVIDARLLTKNGQQQPVKNVSFYLLDKDLETILTEAEIDPIEGQTLTNSLGLAQMYPDRYGDFYRKAMAVIKKHIKYSGRTDGSGKAELGSVDPDSYYIFGMTKAPNGFAVWSAPVSVMTGDNLLNLSPQRLTEVDMSSGE